MTEKPKKKPVLAKIVYNYEDDVFYARPLKRKYDSSLQVSKFIFDLDKKGSIVGLEIPNASKVFNMQKIHLRDVNRGPTLIHIEATEEIIRIDIKMTVVIRNAQNPATLSIERLRPDLITPSNIALAEA